MPIKSEARNVDKIIVREPTSPSIATVYLGVQIIWVNLTELSVCYAGAGRRWIWSNGISLMGIVIQKYGHFVPLLKVNSKSIIFCYILFIQREERSSIVCS